MAKTKQVVYIDKGQHDETCLCRRCRTKDMARNRKRVRISRNMSVSDLMDEFSDFDFYEDEASRFAASYDA